MRLADVLRDPDIIDALEPRARQLLDAIGPEAMASLSDLYGGSQTYIYKFDDEIALYRNKKIKTEFNGYNFTELAKKYGLSENQVRVILKEDTKEVRARPMDGQVSMLEGM